MTSRIAEQDSLERLIARLRSSAKAYRGMLHDSHGNDCDEAADTLCQMRDALEAVRPLVEAARGLSFGTDWNNGTQAKAHGYRRKLLKALPRAIAALTTTTEKE